MNVFRKLWQAIETLAMSLNALASTVDSFSQEVRERALDAGRLWLPGTCTGSRDIQDEQPRAAGKPAARTEAARGVRRLTG